MNKHQQQPVFNIILILNSCFFILGILGFLFEYLILCAVCILLSSLLLLFSQYLFLSRAETVTAPAADTATAPAIEEPSKIESALMLQNLSEQTKQLSIENEALKLQLENAHTAEAVSAPVFYHCPLTASTSVCLNDFLEHYIAEHSSVLTQKGIHFSYHNSAKTAELFLSPSALTLICNNIWDNACKFTPVNGTFYLRVAEVENDVLLIFKNSGSGIGEAELSQIFKLNYQGSNCLTGTGFGLFQVKCIVEDYGGQIWAKSTKDTGFTLYLQLPPQKNLLPVSIV